MGLFYVLLKNLQRVLGNNHIYLGLGDCHIKDKLVVI